MSQHTAGPERPLPPPATTKPATRSYSRSTGAGRVIPPFFRGVRAAAHAPAPAPEADYADTPAPAPEAGYADTPAPASEAGYADTAAAGAAQPVEMPETHPPAVPVEWYVTGSAPPEEAAAAAAPEFEAPAAEAPAAEAPAAEAPAAEAPAAEAPAAEAPAAEEPAAEEPAAEERAAAEPEFLGDSDESADSWTAEVEPSDVWSDAVESPDQVASGEAGESAAADEGWFGWGDPATGRGVADDEPTGFEPPPPYDEPAGYDDLDDASRLEDTASWEAPRTDDPGPGAASADAEAEVGYPLDAFLVSSDSTMTASPAGEGRDIAERVAVQLEELARDLRDNGMSALASRSTSGELARLLAAVVAGFYARDH